MSIFSSLFSSAEVISKGTDALIDVGDKLVFTEEEKQDMNFKLRELHIKTLEAYQPFKIAQRILAIWFSLLFGLTFLISFFIGMANIYFQYKFDTFIPTDTDKSATLIELSYKPITDIVTTFDLGLIVITIVAFYFSGGAIDSLRRK